VNVLRALRRRLLLPLAIGFILFVAVIFGYLLPHVQKRMIEQKQQETVEKVHMVLGLLEELNRLVEMGTLTLSQAQSIALDEIRGIRYGRDQKSYFWVMDYNCQLLTHPYRQDLVAQSTLKDYTNEEGRHLFVEFLELARSEGEGFIQYRFPVYNQPISDLKTSYVAAFGGWEWVIGTGFFHREIRRDIESFIIRMTAACGGIALVVLILYGYLYYQIYRISRRSEQAETEVAQLFSRFRMVFEQTHQLMGMISPDGRVLTVNQTALGMIGMPEEGVRNRLFWETPWWSHDPEVQEECRMAIDKARGGETVQFETTHYTADGRKADILATFTPLLNAEGEVELILAQGVDLTDLKRAEQQLREQDARYRILVENARSLILRLDATGRIRFVNEFALELLGHPEDALLGRSPVETFILPMDDAGRDQYTPFRKMLLAGEDYQGLETLCVSADGRKYWISWSCRALRDESDTLTGENLLAGVNVTTQRQAYEERTQLVAAVETLEEVVLVADTANNVVYANPALERLTGQEPAAWIGKPLTSLLEHLRAGAFIEQVRQAANTHGRDWRKRLTLHHHEGQLLDVEVTARLVRGRGRGWVYVLRDVTREIMEAELRQQSQKMEAMGTLAAGIAHDFNNILNAISGNAELLLDEQVMSPSGRASVDEILTAVERASGLVRQILTYSRQKPGELKPVSLGPLVKEALKLVKVSLPPEVTLHTNITPDLPPVMGDTTQIHQVVLNLCTNAIHAMEETRGGLLGVSLSLARFEDSDLTERDQDLKTGAYVCLTISDTGCGIPEHIRDRIFDPFFTTKPEGKGTGMGLAIVQGVMSSHGGIIRLFSEPGWGTTFRLYFPALETPALQQTHAAEATEPETPAPRTPVQGKGQKILVVDDDRAVLNAMVLQLRKLGFTPVAMPGPREAIATFETDPKSFSLIITDSNMPGMSGITMMERIRLIRPDIPAILVTGLSTDQVDEAAMRAGIRRTLTKPIRMANLGDAIRDVLFTPDHARQEGDRPS